MKCHPPEREGRGVPDYERRQVQPFAHTMNKSEGSEHRPCVTVVLTSRRGPAGRGEQNESHAVEEENEVELIIDKGGQIIPLEVDGCPLI
jgi:hypothetical protein